MCSAEVINPKHGSVVHTNITVHAEAVGAFLKRPVVSFTLFMSTCGPTVERQILGY